MIDTSRKISNCLPNAFYIAEYISHAEEEKLLNHVYSVPKPKWVNLSKRRLQNWGGTPQPKGMVVEPLPLWLDSHFDSLVASSVFDDAHRPNHVLINEYLPGQGIMPHEDGPYYHPTVATISLGCHTILDFYRPVERDEAGIVCEADVSLDKRYLFSLLLERRSLVILSEQMYTSCLHGIAECSEDVVNLKCIANLDLLSKDMKESLSGCQENFVLSRTTARVSLTIRHVLRTIKLKTNLLFKA